MAAAPIEFSYQDKADLEHAVQRVNDSALRQLLLHGQSFGLPSCDRTERTHVTIGTEGRSSSAARGRGSAVALLVSHSPHRLTLAPSSDAE